MDLRHLCSACAQDNLISAEDNLVKEYMSKYGIDNVRGGSYVTMDLSDEERRYLQDELDNAACSCLS